MRRAMYGLVIICTVAAMIGFGGQPAEASVGQPRDGGCRSRVAGPLPFGTGSCPGVRPGALLLKKDGGYCSFNFLFKGSDRRRYIGTAGHCAVEEGKESSWLPGRGEMVWDSEGKAVGRFVYGIWDELRDFALIRLNKDVKASAQMCYFGGPTGLNADLTDELVVLHQYGHGTGVGYEPNTKTHTVSARSYAAAGMMNPDVVYATGVASFGDSGSGVISDDGRAVGVLVSVNAAVGVGDNAGVKIGVTRIAPQLEAAMEALGLRFNLMKAELL